MRITIILMLVFVSLFISACDKECGECPELVSPPPDFCEDGTIISGEIDECGCRSPPICEISSFEDDYINYENGILNYKITIEKPTPCHTIKKEEIIMESYPVQVIVDLTLESSEGMCAQVITEEIVEGTMNIGHKPGSFNIILDEEIIYSSNLKYYLP
jgi:hypothetical protein